MISILLGVVAAARTTEALALNGTTVLAGSIGSEASALLRVDNDGKMYQRINLGGDTQLSADTDWVREASASPGDFEVRFTSLTGDALDFSSAIEDTWWAMTSGDFTLEQTDDTSGLGGTSSTFTLEIRRGSSGSAAVSASYTLTADREDA